MTSKDTSQTQQKARPEPARPDPIADPFANLTSGMEAWGKLAQDNLQRFQSFYDELAGFEAVAYERAKTAGTQMAELYSDTVGYVTQLSAELRNLTLEATRRSGELLSRRA